MVSQQLFYHATEVGRRCIPLPNCLLASFENMGTRTSPKLSWYPYWLKFYAVIRERCKLKTNERYVKTWIL